MPTVLLSFSSLPGHVRTARLVAGALARRAGVAEALLDEVRLGVGEACSRAVSLHREHAPQQPVEVELNDDDHFSVTVRDRGPAGAQVAGSGHVPAADLVDPGQLRAPRDPDAAAPGDGSGPGGPDGSAGPEAPPEDLPGGFGLAVIAGLVEDLAVQTSAGGQGTEVCMTWPTAGDAQLPGREL